MKAVTMLEKLQMQPDAYDVTCLLLVDWRADAALRVSNVNERIPASLQMSAFFKQMVDLTLLRSAPDAHPHAREKRYSA